MEDGECRAWVIIEGVKPEVENGRFPAKRIIGENVMVEADIFTDGHEENRISTTICNGVQVETLTAPQYKMYSMKYNRS